LPCADPGVDGTTLKEAKYINLSLHYLEQVIVALQERSMGMAR
jgi:kinesin family protein 6/9